MLTLCLSDTTEPSEWQTVGAEVIIDENEESGIYKGRRGVIRQVLPAENCCLIYFPDLKTSAAISNNFLRRVVPEKRDKVKVIQGEHKGAIGTLMSVSGSEAIVQLQSGVDIHFYTLSNLVKFVEI
jgi:transcription elongation factor SPT5